MGYERYPRNTNPQGDYYGRTTPQDYGEDYGSGREFSYSSARDYEAAGEIGGDRESRGGYGRHDSFGARDNRGRYAEGRSGRPHDDSHAAGGADRGDRRPARGYGRQPQGYDYENRGFIDRAGDEVRSWFGDDEAERRRVMDQSHQEHDAGRNFSGDSRDEDYHGWRKQQIDALDRDYHEYRQENRQKFHNEFGSWRQERQGQRNSLSRVAEHMDVVGADGEHVGTVDKVRGDRILLTKSDPDAGGHHHSIPSRWIETVDHRVTIRKSASEAHAHWKDEERNQALFSEGYDDRSQYAGPHTLNRSFPGTY